MQFVNSFIIEYLFMTIFYVITNILNSGREFVQLSYDNTDYGCVEQEHVCQHMALMIIGMFYIYIVHSKGKRTVVPVHKVPEKLCC
jgi:hypothetical protein